MRAIRAPPPKRSQQIVDGKTVDDVDPGNVFEQSESRVSRNLAFP
jgi:hypothetical protein